MEMPRRREDIVQAYRALLRSLEKGVVQHTPKWLFFYIAFSTEDWQWLVVVEIKRAEEEQNCEVHSWIVIFDKPDLNTANLLWYVYDIHHEELIPVEGLKKVVMQLTGIETICTNFLETLVENLQRIPFGELKRIISRLVETSLVPAVHPSFV
jgi:hypothetical protein